MRIRTALTFFLLLSFSSVRVYAQTAPQFARDHIYGPGGRAAVTIEPDNYPPDGPYSCSASPGACAIDGVDISWGTATDIGSGVNSYHVYRDGVYIASTSNSYYHDANVQGDTSYTYQVAAMDNVGHEGQLSSGASVYIPLCIGSYLRRFRFSAPHRTSFAKSAPTWSPFWQPTSIEDERPHIQSHMFEAMPYKDRLKFINLVRRRGEQLPPAKHPIRAAAGGGK